MLDFKINKKIKLLNAADKKLFGQLNACRLCPKECGIDRALAKGFCLAGNEIFVYTAFLHQGEEPVISINKGSGAIFFSGCNLKCPYCQNFKFSHTLCGHKFNINKLTALMLNLQKKGAANINLITPTHYLPQIIGALKIAYENGLNIPLIYNTSGYEKKEIIQLLDGIVDIYLPDIKYLNPKLSAKYSQAQNYPQNNQAALLEMHRQKHQYILENGQLIEGMIIRHLVLPGQAQESVAILKWLKISFPEAMVSVMFQYQPYHNAVLYPEINRNLTMEEYQIVKNTAEKIDLHGWIQDFNPNEKLAGTHFEDALED